MEKENKQKLFIDKVKRITNGQTNNFHIATTQIATAENTAINELPLIYDSMQNENENETSFFIKENDLFFEEKGKRVAKISFNDRELLKLFKDKRTSENIEHLHKHLINQVYKKVHLKTKGKEEYTIIITDEEMKALLKMQNIKEVISFMEKFAKYIDSCTVSAYIDKSNNEKKVKVVKIPKFFLGNNFELQEEEKKEKERVRIKNREWTFTINKQYCWKPYLIDYIDLPPYFSTYKGLKWNIINSVFRQIRIQKKIPIVLTIRDLIATSSILNSKGNQRNRKSRIIEPIIKAIQEINTDANNEFIRLDAKIINLAYDAFLNSKVEVKAIGICAEMLENTMRKLRKSKEKALLKQK